MDNKRRNNGQIQQLLLAVADPKGQNIVGNYCFLHYK